MLDILPINTFTHSVKPYIIAGPCSAESEQQLMETAEALAALGVGVFRAGLWKPRTRPDTFEGVGSEGLKWLKEVKRHTQMRVATEVASPEHVEQALSAGIDILWIGARTTANPFAVQEIADALRGYDIPVMVKNPVNPDIDLWIGAMQRLNLAGIRRIAAVHRGFCLYNRSTYRNDPQWHIPIELRRRYPSLPIFCDPSHIGGRRTLIQPLAQQAIDLQFDGLMIECHITPETAKSDAAQQITPAELDRILSYLTLHTDTPAGDEILHDLRRQIDALDTALLELLSKRMEITNEIGIYKKQHNMPVLQTGRYNEIISRLVSRCAGTGLDPDFIKKIFEIIHSQSVANQLKL